MIAMHTRAQLSGHTVRVELYNNVASGERKKGTKATRISRIANTDPSSWDGRSFERLDL